MRVQVDDMATTTAAAVVAGLNDAGLRDLDARGTQGGGGAEGDGSRGKERGGTKELNVHKTLRADKAAIGGQPWPRSEQLAKRRILIFYKLFYNLTNLQTLC